VKAMEIIDKLETTRRGPYGGGIGHVGFNGSMDIALALRTMVIPTAGTDSLYSYDGAAPRRDWTVHLQAGAGLVADSTPELEARDLPVLRCWICRLTVRVWRSLQRLTRMTCC
ncbi:hypothetical protein WJX84_001755, partial [Apatococcus fuscideae]